jgi:hypothetical protein
MSSARLGSDAGAAGATGRILIPAEACGIDRGLSIAAGIVVVAAYAGVQLRALDPFRVPNLVLNFAGTGVLAVVAARAGQYGFVLTNGFWSLISLAALLRLRGRARRLLPTPLAHR